MQHSGRGLRMGACSGTNCGPPLPGGCGPLRFHSEPQIQNSKFKIKQIFRTHLGIHSVSGRGRGRLRPARSWRTGLRHQFHPKSALCRREAAARSVLTDRFLRQDKSAAERTGLRHRGAALRRGGRLQAAAPIRTQNHHSKFKIITRGAACEGPVRSGLADASSGPPPPPGCGPPIAARSIPRQDLP